MSTDNLALLFRLRGDASQLRAATSEARQAVNQLKQAFGPELTQTVSVTNKAFSQVGAEFANFAAQRVPVVGGALSRLTGILQGLGIESKSSDKAVNSVANSIASIAQQSGRSVPQVAQFLTRFVQLGDQSKRNEAAFKEFGGSVDLIGNKTARFIPELERARTELGNVAGQSSLAGGRLAALAGPIGVAVIAVAALVAGLALAGKAMFDIARSTADFQGKMQDLSQQTGVAVETLSTLEVAIATTGGNLTTVTQALVQFQRQLDDAQDPLSKAAGNFEQLGVTVTDTETTLRATLAALAAMPEGFAQTNAAAELFGSRGGKQVLALLKETNGDLDALQKKLADAGILITTDAARAADKFNDELALLEFQTRALTAAIGEGLIPAFTDLIKSTAGAVRGLTPLIKILIEGSQFGVPFRVGISVLSDSLKGLGFVARAVTGDFKGLRQAIKEASEEKFPTIGPVKIPETELPAPPQRSASQTATEEAQLAADALAIVRRDAAKTVQALNEAFERGRINRQKQADDTIEANRRILKADQDRIQAEIRGEEEKHRQIQARSDLAESERIEQLQQIQGRVRKLQQEELNAQSLFDTTSRELRARAAQERANSLRAERDNETNILTKEFDRQIAAIEARIEREGQFENEGLIIIEQLERAKIDARREGLEKQKQIGFLTVEAQQEIDRQVQQLNQDADALEDAQRTRRERRQREHSERMRQLKLAEIQSLLEAERIAGESIIASIEAQAALRIRTEESAAREILRIRLALIDDEQEALQAALKAAGAITNVGERLQAEAELNNRLRIIKAERAALEAAGNRDIDTARQRDLDNEREYADDLREIQERVVDAQRDAAAEAIRLMIASGARRRDIIRAERDLALQEEDDRHQRVTESIRQQQQETDAEIRVLEKRLERLKVGTTEEIEEHDRLIASLERLRAKRLELDAEQEAEDGRSQTRKRRVTVETDVELADPDIALRDAFDAIGESVTSLAGKFAELIGAGEQFAAISTQIAQQIGGTLAGAFNQFANALGQTVANWVLLGETGPAVMRKILAQALASLAAEATVQAIKELALGFATLFFNPAESAAHFTAAALWGSIGGAAAVAGRKVAGDLFKPKETTSGVGGGNQGSGQLDPLRLNRNQPQPVMKVVVVVQPDGTKFGEAVTAHVLEDGRLGGPIRQFNIDDVVI